MSLTPQEILRTRRRKYPQDEIETYSFFQGVRDARALVSEALPRPMAHAESCKAECSVDSNCNCGASKWNQCLEAVRIIQEGS